MAIFEIAAGLLDHRPQLRDQRLLLLLFGAAQGVDHCVRLGRNDAVRVRAQAMDIGWSDDPRIDLPSCHRLEQSQRPFCPLYQLPENRLTQLGGGPIVGRDQLRAGDTLACASERLERLDLERHRVTGPEQRSDGRHDSGIEVANTDQIYDHGHALLVR